MCYFRFLQGKKTFLISVPVDEITKQQALQAITQIQQQEQQAQNIDQTNTQWNSRSAPPSNTSNLWQQQQYNSNNPISSANNWNRNTANSVFNSSSGGFGVLTNSTGATINPTSSSSISGIGNSNMNNSTLVGNGYTQSPYNQYQPFYGVTGPNKPPSNPLQLQQLQQLQLQQLRAQQQAAAQAQLIQQYRIQQIKQQQLLQQQQAAYRLQQQNPSVTGLTSSQVITDQTQYPQQNPAVLNAALLQLQQSQLFSQFAPNAALAMQFQGLQLNSTQIPNLPPATTTATAAAAQQFNNTNSIPSTSVNNSSSSILDSPNNLPVLDTVQPTTSPSDLISPTTTIISTQQTNTLNNNQNQNNISNDNINIPSPTSESANASIPDTKNNNIIQDSESAQPIKSESQVSSPGIVVTNIPSSNIISTAINTISSSPSSTLPSTSTTRSTKLAPWAKLIQTNAAKLAVTQPKSAEAPKSVQEIPVKPLYNDNGTDSSSSPVKLSEDVMSSSVSWANKSNSSKPVKSIKEIMAEESKESDNKSSSSTVNNSKPLLTSNSRGWAGIAAGKTSNTTPTITPIQSSNHNGSSIIANTNLKDLNLNGIDPLPPSTNPSPAATIKLITPIVPTTQFKSQQRNSKLNGRNKSSKDELNGPSVQQELSWTKVNSSSNNSKSKSSSSIITENPIITIRPSFMDAPNSNNKSTTQPITTSLNINKPYTNSTTANHNAESNVLINGDNAFGGRCMSEEFREWCRKELKKLTGTEDITLAQYLITLESSQQIRDYIYEYLGSNSSVQEFADAFLSFKEFDQDNKQQTNSKKTSATNTQQLNNNNNSINTDGKKTRNRRKITKKDAQE